MSDQSYQILNVLYKDANSIGIHITWEQCNVLTFLSHTKRLMEAIVNTEESIMTQMTSAVFTSNRRTLLTLVKSYYTEWEHAILGDRLGMYTDTLTRCTNTCEDKDDTSLFCQVCRGTPAGRLLGGGSRYYLLPVRTTSVHRATDISSSKQFASSSAGLDTWH